MLPAFTGEPAHNGHESAIAARSAVPGFTPDPAIFPRAVLLRLDGTDPFVLCVHWMEQVRGRGIFPVLAPAY
jgi:hypothetical protein